MREEKPVTMVMDTTLFLLCYRNRDSPFVQKLSCLPFDCLMFTVSVLQLFCTQVPPSYFQWYIPKRRYSLWHFYDMKCLTVSVTWSWGARTNELTFHTKIHATVAISRVSKTTLNESISLVPCLLLGIPICLTFQSCIRTILVLRPLGRRGLRTTIA